MKPNDTLDMPDDLDFSDMFESLTDKLGGTKASVPFLSEANSTTYADIKEDLFMKLLIQYEYEISQYLTNPSKVPSNLLTLQEVLIKHKSI